jgi:hypothetical protein
MAISERRRLIFTAIAVILVGIITGLLLGSVLLSGAPPTKTFNIVAYHWGYALYDQDWNEIKQIEVKRGTTVRLVAFPAHLFSHEMVEEFDRRIMDKGFGEYPPGDPRIADLMEAAEEDPATLNHGVFIGPLNVDLRPKSNADTFEEAIDSVEFTADAIGSFDISCSVVCGVGHPYMVLEGALIVK